MSRAIRLLRTAPATPAREDLSTSSLTVAAIRAVREQARYASFLVRRLERQVEHAAAGAHRASRALLGILRDTPGDRAALARGLVCYGGALEEEGRLEEAANLLAAARDLRPSCPEGVLHAARVARKRGLRAEANRLYREVRALAGDGDGLARMARIGEALLAAEPVRALGQALRASIRAGDAEAAAVAQEERAHHRRREGDRGGAFRDYLIASARYPDPVDRARALHAAADLLMAAGDLRGAREVLLVALDEGRPEQRAHARNRLHGLSRALGDELGRRRWMGGQGGQGRHSAPLVSLTPSSVHASGRSRAAAVIDWRRRVRTTAAAQPADRA